MRRIILVVAVALIMAAMMLVMVAPAMAQGPPCPPGTHPQPVVVGTGPPAIFLCVPNGPPIMG